MNISKPLFFRFSKILKYNENLLYGWQKFKKYQKDCSANFIY